jgi:hypothetical protein
MVYWHAGKRIMRERDRKTKKPVEVIGESVAEIVPPTAPQHPRSWLGAMADSGIITGDIVSPASDEQDWDVLR